MMIPFFSEQGRMQASRILREGMLCAFDFDGTLSPFMGYENARLPADVCERLIRLQSMTPAEYLAGKAKGFRVIGYVPPYYYAEGKPDIDKEAMVFYRFKLPF